MKVEMANPESMRLMMSSPQDGGPALGQAHLRPEMLPKGKDGENLFLLSLPNGLGGKWTEGTARHALLRQLIYKYLINDAAIKRQATTDPMTQKLLEALRKVVQSNQSSKDWASSKEGLPGF